MNQAQKWVAKNCRFAMELPPTVSAPAPQPAPTPQPQPMQQTQPSQRDPNWDQMENQFVESLNQLKVLSQNDDSEVDSIEEDRFSPSSGHYTETTGHYNQHSIDMVIGGKVYFPDALLSDPLYAEVGGVAENIIFSFKEQAPDVVDNEIGRWDDIQTEYKILTLQRTGDWYDVTIHCSLSGQSEYEPPERDYEYDDRGDF